MKIHCHVLNFILVSKVQIFFCIFLQADKTIWTLANLYLVSGFGVVITKHLNINKQGLNLSALGAVTQSVFFASLKKAGTRLSFVLLCFVF